MKFSNRHFFVFIFCAFAFSSFANNLNITNAKFVEKNTTSDYITIEFDASWDNSWRLSAGATNWDAAWIFIKYRANNGTWQHAWLNDTGHTAPAGSTINVGLQTVGTVFNPTTNPGLGVFLYRDAAGTGTFTKTGIRLRWNYGANGVADNAAVDIRVIGIETVHIPQVVYNLGNTGAEDSRFYKVGRTIFGPFDNGVFQVSSENLITVGTGTAGNLYYSSGTNAGDQNGPIPATYPKGYNAFYCMKYEISQKGYVDFLNTLTRTQQAARIKAVLPAGTTTVTKTYVMSDSIAVNFRNAIRCNSIIPANDPITFFCDYDGDYVPNEVNDGMDIACNYLRWEDWLAYLDWSGLRPMTELEYEKACRGTATAISGEFAWGNTSINTTGMTLNNIGTSSEGIATNYSTSTGNCMYISSNILGPVRNGIFAANTSNTGRVTSGAAFYGIMEMTGNLWERCITAGNITGRAFTGLHGNGLISASGISDVSNWPTSITGCGLRGGGWGTSSIYLTISSRVSASGAPSTILDYRLGGRGVRKAP